MQHFTNKQRIWLFSLFLCGCTADPFHNPDFQKIQINELERQVSATKKTIERQKEKNGNLNQLLAAINEEESRLHRLVEEEKVLLDDLKNKIVEK